MDCKTPEEINEGKLLKMAKDARIKKELNKLKRLFKDMDKDTKDKVMSLISNAAFMTVTLEDLQETINTEGAVAEYQNGENQWGTKKSPEVEIYNTMIKNQMGIIKQLTDLLPKASPPEAGDELEKFIHAK
jgi:hypothetical protein